MSWNRNWRRNWRKGNRHNWRGPSYDAQFAGTTPGGLATFALDIEAGTYKVRFDWSTGINATRSGKEAQRVPRRTRAQEHYSGSAWLVGNAPRDVRATLAKYAARGEAFLLALTHEELLIQADSTGASSPVDAGELALTDWAKVGQRVVTYREDDDGEIDFVEGVIQSVGASTIVTDTAPGDVGLAGGRIAPARPIYFDPEQDFGRIESAAEQWSIKAHAIDFDFARELASLALGPITACPGLNSASLTERVPGSAPTVQLIADGGLTISLEEVGNAVTVHYRGVILPHDAQQLFDLLSTSTLVAPTGTWGTEDLSLGDEFGPTPLVGGDVEGSVGAGATLVEYEGRPVWDWPIRIAGSTTDSLHALTEIIDMGGVLYAKGFADMSDWGRAVAMRSPDRYDWQWFKLFMTTVRGRQKSWWLPSWRSDLPFVSKDVGTITVEGDVGTWYPRQREHIQVTESDGTVTRAKITEALNNGDGTWTLTIGTTLASSNVATVSWLELCRFEREDFEVTWGSHGFEFATTARVTQP